MAEPELCDCGMYCSIVPVGSLCIHVYAPFNVDKHIQTYVDREVKLENGVRHEARLFELVGNNFKHIRI